MNSHFIQPNQMTLESLYTELISLRQEVQTLREEVNMLKNKESLNQIEQFIKQMFQLSSTDTIDLSILKNSTEETTTLLNQISSNIYFMSPNKGKNSFTYPKFSIKRENNIQMMLSTQFSFDKKYQVIKTNESKYKLISNDFYYTEIKITGNEPIVSLGCVVNGIGLEKHHPGWDIGTIGFHSDDGKLFHEDGIGRYMDEPFGIGDVIGCGYSNKFKLTFFTRNGRIIEIIPLCSQMNYFAIGLNKYETVTVNTGENPYVFDFVSFINEMNDISSQRYISLNVVSENFSGVIRTGKWKRVEFIKQKFIEILNQKRFNSESNTIIKQDDFEWKERYYNHEAFISEDYSTLYERIDFIIDQPDKLLSEFTQMDCLRLHITSTEEYKDKMRRERQLRRRMEMERSTRVVKPVILLYDDEKKENEEVNITLKLNNDIDIGMTYPQPTEIGKKEYQWSGKYTSNGTNEACQIIIGEKKYEYLFWEGPPRNKEAFKGQVIGINKGQFVTEIEILLEKLGLNEREINDFIVYWLTKLNQLTAFKVTICDKSYDNEIAQLEVNGFTQIHRVMLKFEEVETIEGLPTIESISPLQRPSGKYIIEWGAVLA